MSSSLYNLDNNRTVDDEGDEISLLFPKCKPRILLSGSNIISCESVSNNTNGLKADRNANISGLVHHNQSSEHYIPNVIPDDHKLPANKPSGLRLNISYNSQQFFRPDQSHDRVNGSPHFRIKSDKIDDKDLKKRFNRKGRYHRVRVSSHTRHRCFNRQASRFSYGTPFLKDEPSFSTIRTLCENQIVKPEAIESESDYNAEQESAASQISMEFDPSIVDSSNSKNKIGTEREQCKIENKATGGDPLEGASLRDSRIEIAGGREIFSQSRGRIGRRAKAGESSRCEYEDESFRPSAQNSIQQLNPLDSSPMLYSNTSSSSKEPAQSC